MKTCAALVFAVQAAMAVQLQNDDFDAIFGSLAAQTLDDTNESSSALLAGLWGELDLNPSDNSEV